VLRRILANVRVRTGHDFSNYKRATVFSTSRSAMTPPRRLPGRYPPATSHSSSCSARSQQSRIDAGHACTGLLLREGSPLVHPRFVYNGQTQRRGAWHAARLTRGVAQSNAPEPRAR
jgi:hypothetical protein